ncbi:MAG: GNAT family N-acetyltransferase [Bacteroidales bacterium]|jgi:ribosomal protein S18 acetylase RimI-like enzyme|nr:GNAT family N-acetyltransferase [Bacteroidales bacterium]
MSPITIVNLDSTNYLKHRSKLIELYTLSFTEGEHAQHIPIEEIEKSLDDRLRIGFGLMAIQRSNIVGVVLCLSLENDPEFPFDKHKDINPAKTIYITDLMVNAHYRGQGVAQKMLEYLFQSSKAKHYDDAVIRVWDKNIPAVSLYKKLGFKEIDTIFQTKLMKETKEPFEMRKIYMQLKS